MLSLQMFVLFTAAILVSWAGDPGGHQLQIRTAEQYCFQSAMTVFGLWVCMYSFSQRNRNDNGIDSRSLTRQADLFISEILQVVALREHDGSI
jgi:hypothetical protein